jgi:mannose-6-phosphate isomerase-like protein (cupin superfamily)
MAGSGDPWFSNLEVATARALAASPAPFSVEVANGTMSLGLYAPRGHDPQQPHAQDEIYIIACGHGDFVRGDARRPFRTGDAFFVPAGMPHRFENFSDDFLARVVFYGPNGGEPPA